LKIRNIKTLKELIEIYLIIIFDFISFIKSLFFNNNKIIINIRIIVLTKEFNGKKKFINSDIKLRIINPSNEDKHRS
tara:strand:+ start:5253 stop:5483 length:231 start_codon:yes stop_codon:yes gene_type:complete